MVCLDPINGRRTDRQGNRCAACSWAVPFSVRLRRQAEKGGPCSPAACPATQWDKISVRLPGSIDATCVFINGCVAGHPAFPFACPTGVILPWQAIDRTATSFQSSTLTLGRRPSRSPSEGQRPGLRRPREGRLPGRRPNQSLEERAGPFGRETHPVAFRLPGRCPSLDDRLGLRPEGGADAD